MRSSCYRVQEGRQRTRGMLNKTIRWLMLLVNLKSTLDHVVSHRRICQGIKSRRHTRKQIDSRVSEMINNLKQTNILHSVIIKRHNNPISSPALCHGFSWKRPALPTCQMGPFSYTVLITVPSPNTPRSVRQRNRLPTPRTQFVPTVMIASIQFINKLLYSTSSVNF